jgi:hypothetical protein
MDYRMKLLPFIALFGIAVGVIVFGPFITIWSLNTLFTLSIEYTLETWCAVVWLLTITFGNVVTTIQKKK